MKLSTKLISGFLVVALITAVVGYIGWWGLTRLNAHVVAIGEERLPSIMGLQGVVKELETLRVAQRSLLNSKLTPEQRESQFANIDQARKNYGAAFEAYRAAKKTAAEAEQFEKTVARIADWKKVNDRGFDTFRAISENHITDPDYLNYEIQMFRGDHYALATKTGLSLLENVKFDGGDDHTACRFGKWLAQFSNAEVSKNSQLAGLVAQMVGSHTNFHASVKEIKRGLAENNQEAARAVYREKMLTSQNEVFAKFDAITGMIEEVQKAYANANDIVMVEGRKAQQLATPEIAKLVEINTQEARQSVASADADGIYAKTVAAVAVVVGMFLALGFGVALSLSLSRNLNRIINSLNEGASQVASASSNISAASQQLAEGATEQAASLEETSSSLEEMASMTRQNADNAATANRDMEQTKAQVGKGAVAVRNMAQAMGEINGSSVQIGRIIKTIEEIAFQTNLLALNAAVEAARAGEAGKGFAVVADEVRNLAQRSAQAARDTAELIEGTVQRVKNGADIVSQLESSFGEVEASAGKVAKLISEITVACQEQAQGVDQVNTAVAQMDKVTQSNAANAEESASASEELSAQAEQMRSVVGELLNLVAGTSAQMAQPASPYSTESARYEYPAA